MGAKLWTKHLTEPLAKIEAGQRNIYLNELKLFKDIFKVNYEAFFENTPENDLSALI